MSATGDRPSGGDGAAAPRIDRDGRLYCAVIGAAVTVMLSILPFSPVLGGAVAGDRYGGGYLDGAAVGALAGVGAAVPLAALYVPAVWVVGLLGFGVAPSAPGYGLFLAVLGALFLCYAVGLSALGGALGVWTDTNTAVGLDPGTWLG